MKGERMGGGVGGFTLVELLVTVSIISVLAGMLLPVLGRAKGQAKTAQCLSNARQLGIAVMLYVGDHRETYPPSSDYGAPTDLPERVWPMVVSPYARNGKVFECPSAKNSGFVSNWVSRGHGSIGYTTATAYDPLAVEGFPSFLRESALENPSLVPLFGDTPSGPTAEKYRGYTFDPYNGAPHAGDARLGRPLVAAHDLVKELAHLPPAALKPMLARHRNRVMLIFADGHADAHGTEAILAGNAAGLHWRFRAE